MDWGHARAPRVLGVDPGGNRMGWGLVEGWAGELRIVSAGALKAQSPSVSRTGHKLPPPVVVKCRNLGRKFTELLRALEPDLLVVETPYLGRFKGALVGLAAVRGVLVHASANLPWADVTAKEVRRLLTPTGRSDKLEVRDAIDRAFPGVVDPAWGFDETDALACALSWPGLVTFKIDSALGALSTTSTCPTPEKTT